MTNTNNILCAAVVCVFAAHLQASEIKQPKGVILVVIDDIGYGDIDLLHPSDLETPSLDNLCRQSVFLTDFHVGTTCAPTRASMLTGRHVNATGVWHTIAGRELLRQNEQTMADVFRANGWSTGIFGKWHLGEGYPFSPRFRGFDVSFIHGGGGVGQGPDFWKNDYYSGVDFEGKETQPDTYFVNGKATAADKFCTDYWFDNAMQFIDDCNTRNTPFFCYIPTNAAHGPFNAPHRYKKGFDGLVENVDTNMQRLDQFLDRRKLMDDILLIFTCDNGTTGNRLGGLRERKGSHYDGGHNVPCFLRWKNGGLGGSVDAHREIHSLTAAMDLLPTFIDWFELKKPSGGQELHGKSLKDMLTNRSYKKTSRTLIVDTQRNGTLTKWKRACVMKDEVVDGEIEHKWRMTRKSAKDPFEVYDFKVDRDTDENIADQHQQLIETLASEYESWWKQISPGSEAYPPFVLNSSKEKELTLFAHSWIGDGGTPWHQQHVRKAQKGSRICSVRFDEKGRYRFELRRWPREDGGLIAGPSKTWEGKRLPVKSATISIHGIGSGTKPVSTDDVAVTFELDVQSTDATTLQTAFLDSDNKVLSGAYYVYIKKID